MATANVKIDIKSYECSLCLDIFQDPRLLPCGHTVCGPKSTEKCIENLDPRKNGEIRCPECQTDHKVVVACLPPDYKARGVIASYNASKAKKCCPEHGMELKLRCITDGKEICLDCVMNQHSGHQIEGIHKKEQERLAGYWKSQNTELEGMQLKCKRRIRTTEQEIEFLQNQLLQERSLDNNIGTLIANRDAITRKLESNDFNPDDENILALKVFMEELEATSDSQVEASQEVRKHNQEVMQLVDSRTATYCNNLHINAATQTKVSQPQRRQSGAPSSSKHFEKSVEDREAVQSRPQLITNILAFGISGRHYLLNLRDNTWPHWRGKGTGFSVVHGAVCYKQKVYVIGAGRSDRLILHPSSDVYIYSLTENRWTKGPKLKTARREMACCVVESNRTIYVCGGCQSSVVMLNYSVVNTVEKLELDESGDPVGEWTRVKSMKDKRDLAAAVAVGNRLFVTGGSDYNEDLSSVEVYDVNTEEWSYGPPMKQSRKDHAAVQYQNNIYVLGGRTDADNELSCCEKLDIQTGTWIAIVSMRVPRYHFGSVVANDKVYVIGGHTDESKEDNRSVEVYDIASNTWSTGPKVPEVLQFTRCVSW